MQIILRVITDLDLSKRSRLAAKVFQLNVYDLLHYLNIPTQPESFAYCIIVPKRNTWDVIYRHFSLLMRAVLQQTDSAVPIKAKRKTLRICKKNK